MEPRACAHNPPTFSFQLQPHFPPQGAFTHWWVALIQAPPIYHSPSKICSQPPLGPGECEHCGLICPRRLGALRAGCPEYGLEKRVWALGGRTWSQRDKSGVLLPQWPNLSSVLPKAIPRKRHHLGSWASSQDRTQKCKGNLQKKKNQGTVGKGDWLDSPKATNT